MGKMLIIAEKPSVARDIASALKGFSKEGNGTYFERSDAIVSCGIGHLVRLVAPEANQTGRDIDSLPIIPKQFSLEVIERTKQQFNVLSKLMKRNDVSTIVNACDAGREGELIFRLIYEAANCNKPISRMWLQSMTSDAIISAFDNKLPGEKFDNLADAAKCRSESDWLIGINGSRGITRLRERQTQAYEQMTAGRVQTPTLAIVVDREQEIKNFVPKDYWELHATFLAQAGQYQGRWVAKESSDSEDKEQVGSRFFDLQKAKEILAKCQGQHPSSVKDSSKTTKSSAPRLFDLTTLQREANRRFKLSAKQTLDIAQALYEKHKATTYPRTDANALPEDYVDTAKQVMDSLRTDPNVGAYSSEVMENNWVVPNKKVFDNSKISDHFAIIPTGTKPSGLSKQEAQVYDLIVRRFIAVFYPDAQFNLTTRITVVQDELFKSTGRVLIEQGWLKVYDRGSDQDKDSPVLCSVDPAEQVQTKDIELKALQTKPPARFTEATLLSAMEGAGKLLEDDELQSAMKESGLGTPATRAAIIEGLLSQKDSRGRNKESYLVRTGKEQHLVPTEKGTGLITFLQENGVLALTSPALTGEWEQKLKLMEKGQYSRQAFMQEMAKTTHELIDVIRNKAASIPQPKQEKLSVPCPKCGSGVIAKPRTFDCESNCGFKVWRDIASRDLSDSEAEVLFSKRETQQLEGFVSRAKKKFSAILRLNDEFKVEFVFPERPKTQLGEAIGAPCPNCGSNVHITTGENRQFVCEDNDFRIWQTIAGRELTIEEARSLLTDGYLSAVHGFVSSRTKKAFTAGLELSKDNSKVQFVFDN